MSGRADDRHVVQKTNCNPCLCDAPTPFTGQTLLYLTDQRSLHGCCRVQDRNMIRVTCDITFFRLVSNSRATVLFHHKMSIASPNNDARTTDPSIATSVFTIGPGCAPTVLVPSAPREQWWHSQPVATFLSSPPAATPLALTTVYTYPSECAERWMLSLLPACANFAADSTAAGNRTVFSIDPGKGIVSDPRYSSCQPFSTPTYSPGVCPDGHTVAEVTASFFTLSKDIQTFWQASCCKR